MYIIYFLVSLGATTIGAIAGLGGGVIIKPVLDFMGDYDVTTIGLLSSTTVFCMALVSIIRQIKCKTKIETKKTIYIGLGSIIGGILGERLLKILVENIGNNTIKMIQNISLFSILIMIMIYMIKKEKLKKLYVSNLILCVLAGIFLGLMASFLGIGGGPINICVLSFMFSMESKEAAVNSIVTIIFAQASQLLTVFHTRGIESFNHPMLPIMIIGGIIGGLMGSKLNRLLNNKTILSIFNAVNFCLIILTLYNIFKSI